MTCSGAFFSDRGIVLFEWFAIHFSHMCFYPYFFSFPAVLVLLVSSLPMVAFVASRVFPLFGFLSNGRDIRFATSFLVGTECSFPVLRRFIKIVPLLKFPLVLAGEFSR